jgi:hypothetical protein
MRFCILLLISFLVSCESFEPATQVQCETLCDHIVTLSSEKNVADSKDSLVQNDLMNSFATTGLDLLFNITGEKDKIVRRCLTTLNQREVLNCIETKNKKAWKEDCPLEIE